MTEGVRASFFIAFTFRSGSNPFCESLRTAGCGQPYEFFQPPLGVQNRLYYDRVGADPNNFKDFLCRLVNQFSQHGIFGAKVCWEHRNALDAALLHHFPERGTIDAVFGQPTWIHLTRRDKIGQAISMWRANETGIWDKTPESSRPGEAPQPAYDFNNIQSALLYILGCDHHWAQWFQRKSIQPIHITYEDYLTAKADTLFRVIAPVQKRAGITLAASPADLKFSTRFAIQRDAYTEAIRERFIADIDRLGLGT